ncbi:hypothetical protein, partial [Streptomyces sp. NPDC093093]|uniref:hypothetical protein n=1 Tax=Streptomyces sp. NPDC093093 TaxID=3366025 RepID=UPI0037F6FCCF
AGAVGTGPWTRLAARHLLFVPFGAGGRGAAGSAGADLALLRRAERTRLAAWLHPFGSAGADRRNRPRRLLPSPGSTVEDALGNM